jgi:hypothetical protein
MRVVIATGAATAGIAASLGLSSCASAASRTAVARPVSAPTNVATATVAASAPQSPALTGAQQANTDLATWNAKALALPAHASPAQYMNFLTAMNTASDADYLNLPAGRVNVAFGNWSDALGVILGDVIAGDSAGVIHDTPAYNSALKALTDIAGSPAAYYTNLHFLGN